MPKDEIKTGGEVVVYEGANMLDIIRLAVDKIDSGGAESAVAVIERLADLKIKLDKVEAEKEFNKALAEFQEECPSIKKTGDSKKGVSRAGSSFGYKYAELDEIANTVRPLLFKKGFSFNWDTTTTGHDTEKPILSCTCYLRHRNGHFITSSYSAPVVKEVGSMNEVQRHSTVKTITMRQTLVDALGLTTTEHDTDGVDPSTIDEKQLKILNVKIKQSGANEAKLLKYLEIDELKNLRKVDFATAFYALEQKKTQAEKNTEPTEEATPKQIAKLKIQIKDIEKRKDELDITQPRIDNYKTIIANPMTFEEAEKLSITLGDVQGSGA